MTSLRTYPAPAGIPSVDGMKMEANHQPVFLYQASVYPPPFLALKKVPFGYFDFWGAVDISIETPWSIESVDIRPKSLGITAEHKGNTLSFRLENPAHVSVEVNGSIDNTILVFANPLETHVPDAAAHGVLHFPPGIHDAGIIELKDNQTLCLAGGAYVYGMIRTDNASNVRITGRGILCAERMPRGSGKCVQIDGGRSITVEGIVILDPPNWTVRTMGCDNVSIRNLKIIGWRGNSDGIDVCGSRDVSVKDCFIRNWDDGLAVKAFNTGDCRNIHFSNCTLWTDFARPIEIGYENRADQISDISFTDIDIIHALSGYPVTGIHQGDRAIIRDILFENIRIEDAPNAQLFDFRIKPSAWNRDAKPGRIHSVRYKGVSLNGKPGCDRLPADSRIEGYSNESMIEDLTFEEINILGTPVHSLADCHINCNEFTKDIRFVDGNRHAFEGRVPVASQLQIQQPLGMDPDGTYRVQAKVKVTNLSEDRTAQGHLVLDISPQGDVSFLSTDRFEYTLAPGQVAEHEFEFALLPGKYFVTTQTNSVGLQRDWQLLELPWIVNRIPRLEPHEMEGELSQLPARPVTHFDGNTAGSIKLALMEANLILEADILESDLTETSSDARIATGERESVAFTKGAFGGKKFIVENEPYPTSAIEIFSAMPVRTQPGDAVFILPETAIGRTTALIQGETGPVLAPELRNILEITHVFKNQPKVERIGHVVLEPGMGNKAKAHSVSGNESVKLEKAVVKVEATDNGYKMLAVLPLSELALTDTVSEFWLEIMVSCVLPGETQRRAITVFHSLRPGESAQMFGRVGASVLTQRARNHRLLCHAKRRLQ